MSGSTDSLIRGQRAAAVSALVSLGLAGLKALAGWWAGSLVLLSDAADSAADAAVMLVSWAGLRIARRKPDERFPYGYFKAESVVALFVSLLICYAGMALIRNGYGRILVTPEVASGWWPLAVAIVSAGVSLALWRYLGRIGRHLNSHLLLVSAQDRWKDALTTSAVAVTLILSWYQVPYVEGLMTLAIAGLVLRVGVTSVIHSVLALMDMSPSRQVEQRVRETIESTDDIEGITDLKLRRSGPFILGEAAVRVAQSMNVHRGHEVADRLEQTVRGRIPQIMSFVVHVEPVEPTHRTLAIPIAEAGGLDSSVEEHFGRAPFFLFVELASPGITRTNVRQNPYRDQ